MPRLFREPERPRTRGAHGGIRRAFSYNGLMVEAPTRPAAAPSRPPPRARTARLVATAAAALLVLAGLVLVAASFAPYETVKETLDGYASDGDADLSRERFAAMVWQFRGLGALLAIAGAAAYRLRGRLAELAETLIASAAADCAAAARALRRGLATEPRLHLGALGTIVVVSVLVRLEFLFQPMRYDEAGTYVHYASKPLYIGLTAYTAPNNHLLNTALVHLSTGVFGNHPWAIRLPALLAGVVLVPATYLAARMLYGRSSALLAAALVATSSVLIEYSTNARGYTAVALCFVLLLALAAQLRDRRSPAAWAAFAVVGALGFFAVPTMLYAFGAVVVWLGWSMIAERRRRLLATRLVPAIVGVAGLTLLLYAPVLAASGVRSLLVNPFVTPSTWSYFADNLPSSLASTFSAWSRDQPRALSVALAAGFVVGLVLHRRVSRVSVPPAAGALVFIPPVLALQRVVPFERVWLFLLPLCLMTAAAGLLLLVRRLEATKGHAVAVALVAVALSVSLAGKAFASRAVYLSEDTSTFRDAPGVAAFLADELRPGDRVLAAPPADLILEYYLGAEGLDAGRLLYAEDRPRRLLAVVKEGPREYPLPTVVRWRLEPREADALAPVLVRRYPQARVYELERR